MSDFAIDSPVLAALDKPFLAELQARAHPYLCILRTLDTCMGVADKNSAFMVSHNFDVARVPNKAFCRVHAWEILMIKAKIFVFLHRGHDLHCICPRSLVFLVIQAASLYTICVTLAGVLQADRRGKAGCAVIFCMSQAVTYRLSSSQPVVESQTPAEHTACCMRLTAVAISYIVQLHSNANG